jgi:hypothetical protein
MIENRKNEEALLPQALDEVRRSITELEHKLADENLSANTKAFAARALKLIRKNEETLLLQALDAFERPPVLQ